MGEQTTPQALSSEPAADQAAIGPSEQLPPPPQFPTDSFLFGANQPDSRPKLAPNHSKRNQVPNSSTASYSQDGTALVDRAYLKQNLGSLLDELD